MKLLFRSDASKKIGTGHVMRCITVAKKAQRQGWYTCFVLRDPNQNIVDLVHSTNSELYILTSNYLSQEETNPQCTNEWLPVSQEIDASETLNVVHQFKPDWIIVDHYGLDVTWHDLVKQSCKKIMVIDDLGNRQLNCDVLLDQNLGTNVEKYSGKLSHHCDLLLGPRFALLRDEFRDWRGKSLKRRQNAPREKILITMGGVDDSNYTLQILKELCKSNHAKKCKFTIITGGLYPHLEKLNAFVNSSKFSFFVLSNVTNMAELMSNSDLCIGAAGSTSWERCCLGLPTITFSIANNQEKIATELRDRNLSIYSNIKNLKHDFDLFFNAEGKDLMRTMTLNMRSVCDGLGSSRIINYLK